jgi:hypothetical protein
MGARFILHFEVLARLISRNWRVTLDSFVLREEWDTLHSTVPANEALAERGLENEAPPILRTRRMSAFFILRQPAVR